MGDSTKPSLFHAGSTLRCQTTIDFIVGITLFLFVVTASLLFVPDMIEPFDPNQDTSSIMADRGADHLTQDVLRADSEAQYILDPECTAAFFDGDATSECDVSSDSVQEIVGIESRADVYIRVYDDSGSTVSLSTATGTVQLEIGGDVNRVGNKNIHSATRVVAIDGNRYEFEYYVW